jgi:hypothetical protein
MGEFVSTGIRPQFADKFDVSGIVLPKEIFASSRI